jgi:hypothetical protein
MPQMVVRNLYTEHVYELGPFRTRTNQTHVSPQHIPQLWNFIHARKTEKLSNPRNTWIIIQSPSRSGIRLRVRAHCPKLEAVEDNSISSNTLLAVQNWSCGGHLDGQKNERKQGKRK